MSALVNLTPELHADDLADLRRSGLSDQTITSMGCLSVEAETIRSQTEVKRVREPGYRIPYAGVTDQTGQPYARYRLRQPIGEMRYVSGLGDDAQLYVPPAFATLPTSDLLVVTEGEKKASKAVQEGVHCVAIQGVWSWCDAGHRAVEKNDGDRVSDSTLPISSLMEVVRKYKRVLVLGDSDLFTNPQARRGLELLTKSLLRLGIRAGLGYCPPATVGDEEVMRVKKQGLDDWLIADRSHAVRSLRALFSSDEVNRAGISDTYNALAFAEHCQNRLVFSRGAWHVWNGSIWVVDTCGRRRTLVPEIADQYQAIADDLGRLVSAVTAPFAAKGEKDWPNPVSACGKPHLAAIKILREAAKRIANLRGIESALTLAQPHLRVADDVWDRNPYLLAVRNGVVDLRTSEILPSLPTQWITKCAGSNADQHAKPEQFLKFLAQVQPDADIRDYLQRLMGYSATGLANEQKIFTFVGGGRNGKGTFMGLMMDALCDYAVKGPLSLLAEQSPEKPRNDIAALSGARLVSISESSANLKLDEATIKLLTGEDVVTARFLYREHFQFRPCFTPILDTNHPLRPRDTGEGMWRRISAIPWSVTIPEEQQDKKLRERLLEELPGILAWVIEGARLYIESGLPELNALTEVNESLRESCDPLRRWMETQTQHGPQLHTQSSALYNNFRIWSQAEGDTDVMSQRTFTQHLVDKGLILKKTRGLMFWSNLGLRKEPRDEVRDEERTDLGAAPKPAEAAAQPTTVRTSEAAALQKRLSGGSAVV
jgi:P4 family phage/plasmid primase-like protien